MCEASRAAAAEWIQKRGGREECWSHDAFFINLLPCCITKGFCTGILLQYLDQKIEDLKKKVHSCTIVLFKSSFQTNFHGNHFFFGLRTELSHISIRGRQQEDTSFISCCSKTRLLCAHLVAKQDMMRAARAHTSLDLRAVAAGSPPSRGQKNKKTKKNPLLKLLGSRRVHKHVKTD